MRALTHKASPALRLWLIVVGSAVLWPASAAAQDAYAEHLAAGRTAAEAEDWAAAIQSFERARQTQDSARANFFLARALYRSGQYARAYSFLRIARTGPGGGDPLTEGNQRIAEEAEGRIRQHIGVFAVITRPAGASVTVDSQPLVVDAEGHLVLPRGGPYRIVATLDGQRREREIRVPEQRQGDIIFDLTAPPAPVSTPPTTTTTTTNAAATRASGPSSTHVGGGVQADAIAGYIAAGAFAVGTIGTLVWLSDRAAAVTQCESVGCANPDPIAGELAASVGLGGLFLGLGVGALGSGIALTLSDARGLDRALPLLIIGAVMGVGAGVTGGLWAERQSALDACGTRAAPLCDPSNRAAIEDERNSLMFTSLAFIGATASFLAFGLGSLAIEGGTEGASSVSCMPTMGGVRCVGQF